MKKTTKCPDCKKMIANQGLANHRRYAHPELTKENANVPPAPVPHPTIHPDDAFVNLLNEFSEGYKKFLGSKARLRRALGYLR
jgi:hypothetical protein